MLARHLFAKTPRLNPWLGSTSAVAAVLKPQRPVIVLAAPRTGSTLMAEYLSSLPGLQYLNAESLNPRSFPILDRIPNNPLGRWAVKLKLRKDCLQCQPNRAVLKLMTSQLNDFSLSVEAVQRCFPQAQFVIIYRRSLARMYVSRKKAMLSDQWQQRGKAEQSKPQSKALSLRFEPEEMQTYAESIRDQYRAIQSVPGLSDRSIAIAYEDLCEDAEAIFRGQVCDFLGTPYQPLSSSLNRQSRGDWKAAVENLEDLEAYLDRWGGEMQYPV